MKKLLLSLMALVGVSSAFAQTTYYSNDYEDGTVQWVSRTSGRYTAVLMTDDTKYASVDQSQRQNNGTGVYSNETNGKVAAGTSFTLTCRVKLGASNNQAATAFNIYDATNSTKILSIAEGVRNATAWKVNDNASQLVTISAGGGKTLDALAWYTIQVTYYEGATFLTVKDADGNFVKETDGEGNVTTTWDRVIVNTTSAGGGLGKLEFITSRYNANFAIDDIVVRDAVDSDYPAGMKKAAYTIKWLLDGAEFMTETRKDIVGKKVALQDVDSSLIYKNDDIWKYASMTLSADTDTVRADGDLVFTMNYQPAAEYKVAFIAYNKTDGYFSVQDTITNIDFIGIQPNLDAYKVDVTTGGQKYIYNSVQNANRKAVTESDVIAADGSTLYNIRFTTAKKYQVSLLDNFGDTLSVDSVFQGNEATLFFPYNIFKEGKLYAAGDPDQGSKSYGKVTGVTLDKTAKADVTVTMQYTEDETGNCVYYSEAENIDGITVVDDQYTQIRQSNGKCGFAAADNTEITTLPAGKYTLTSATRSSKTATVFTVAGQTALSIESSGSVTVTTGDEFVVFEDTPVYVSAGSATKYFDYVLIRKTGDVVPEKHMVNIDVEATKSGVVTYDELFSNKTNYVLLSDNNDGTYNVCLPALTSEKYGCSMNSVILKNVNPTEGASVDGTITVTKGEKTATISNFKVLSFTDNADEGFSIGIEGTITGADNADKISVYYQSEDFIPTALKNVEAAGNAAATGKFFKNGQIIIVKNNKKFNAAGQQVK